MDKDTEGFLYPKVNMSLCIDCGLCEKVCHVINPYDKRTPIRTIAAKSDSSDIRTQSSSGGIFTLLSNKLINEKGIVFGSRFDDEWQVLIDHTDEIKGISSLRKSKYVQSRTGNAFIDCERFLNNGKKVLFVGTPCQIAGLLHYLHKPYENLITADVACHGVPSPKIWAHYLDIVNTILKKDNSDSIFSDIKSLKYHVFYRKDEDCLELTAKRHENDYLSSFIFGTILRPSCYNCYCKNFRSGSDITIADFWGIQKLRPDFDDDMGVNLIVVNSSKGDVLMKELSMCQQVETDMTLSISANQALTHSASLPLSRNSCFMNKDVNFLIPSLRASLKGNVHRKQYIFIKKVKKIVFYISTLLSTKGEKDTNRVEIKTKKDFSKLLAQKEIGKILYIDFRDKTNGWYKYRFTIKVALKNKII